MAGSAHSVGFVCVRCGFATSPRSGRAPRFCAVCGQPLSPAASAAPDAALRPAGSLMSTETMMAFFAGLLAIIPIVGIFFSFVAVLGGLLVLVKGRGLDGVRPWTGIALISIVLGLVGGLVNVVVLGGGR
jgi:hypothetical protein